MALNDYITIPSATAGATASRTTTAWGYSDYATLSTGESSKIAVYGVLIHHDVVSIGASLDVTYESLLELYYGESDTLFAQIPLTWRIDTRVNWTFTKLLQLPEGVEVPQGQRIRCRVADSMDDVNARNYVAIKLMYRDLGTYTPPISETLTAESGAYTLTGQSVNLLTARKLTAEQGTYTLTGQTVNFAKGYRLTAESGSYPLTGQDVTLITGRKLTAEAGTYTVTGHDATLRADRKVTADTGTYAVTGNAVGLTTARKLTAESGAYTLTGQSVTFSTTRTITAESGTYAITGNDVTLVKTGSYFLTAESGSYTLTGNDVTLVKSGSYTLTADSGTYSLTGQDVALKKGYVLDTKGGEGVSSHATLPTDLVSYWELNETSGTREDAHGSNDLQDYNTVGYDATFNGADFEGDSAEALTITDASQNGLDFYQSSFSFSIIIKPESILSGDGNILLTKWQHATNNQWHFHLTQLTLHFLYNTSSACGGFSYSSKSIAHGMTAGNTYHIVSVFDYSAKTWKLYVNNDLKGTATNVQASMPNCGATVHLSGRHGYITSASAYDGLAKYLGMWSKVLTADEITALYSLGDGLPYEAETSLYELTGQDVSFVRHYTLTAESGTYALTGNDITLTKVSSYLLTAESGAYTITGNAVTLAKGRTMTAESGTYTLTGMAVEMTRTRFLVVDSGIYVITGNDVSLCMSGTASWTSAGKNSASWTSAGKNSASWSSDKTKRKNICV